MMLKTRRHNYETMVKTQWYDEVIVHYTTMKTLRFLAKLSNLKNTLTPLRFYHRSFIFVTSYQCVFTILVSPSFRHVFTIVASCIVIKTTFDSLRFTTRRFKLRELNAIQFFISIPAQDFSESMIYSTTAQLLGYGIKQYRAISRQVKAISE